MLWQQAQQELSQALYPKTLAPATPPARTVSVRIKTGPPTPEEPGPRGGPAASETKVEIAAAEFEGAEIRRFEIRDAEGRLAVGSGVSGSARCPPSLVKLFEFLGRGRNCGKKPTRCASSRAWRPTCLGSNMSACCMPASRTPIVPRLVVYERG